MRWFLIIVCFAIAVAAGTVPLWWETLGGTLSERLSHLATWISALAGLLGVVVAVIVYFTKGNGRDKPVQQTVEGSNIKGNVSIKNGDFVGRNNNTLSQGKSK